MGFSVNRRISLRSPTCAGKRAWPYRPPTSGRDHPRVCGEKGQVLTTSEIKKGSPPRVRGKVVVRLVLGHSLGITPACAGKRTARKQPKTLAGDHPRVCGEKKAEDLKKERKKGSPPRVRGKATAQERLSTLTGITPACAGKRDGLGTGFPDDQDHPRVCGEKR